MKLRLRQVVLGLALGLGVCLLARSAMAAPFVFPAPAAVLAEQGSSNGSEREVILDLVNFILLLAALGYLLRNPAMEFFARRTASISGKLEEGAKALQSAQERLAEVEGKLAGLDEEIAQLRSASEKDMEVEHRRIRHETSEEVVRIQQLAQAQIAAATRAARIELKRTTVGEAIGQAREMIRSRMGNKDQRRLVKFFLANLRSIASDN
jgi:F0F1-type ATP synthase membrane subunit b/b'